MPTQHAFCVMRRKGGSSISLSPGHTPSRNCHGRRPLGTTFYFTNSVEVQQPIDALTHEITGSIEYAQKSWSLRLAYLGSIYENDVNTLLWDNPFRLDDAAFGPSRGRFALAPDNQAHTLSLNGAVHLPWRSRLTGTLSYGWMLQNHDFLPYYYFVTVRVCVCSTIQ
jgi:Putative outer membrane beta-barrel porin, MtrB/PioB